MMIELYDNLMSLCQTCDKMKFYFKDDISPFGNRVRIFSYNYASYTDWCEADALECRGIMFEMDDNGPVRIMARPMEKFFNLGETPFTMNLDLKQKALITAKEDGSLVSTFVDGSHQHLYFKSKGSIKSSQSAEALQVIKRAENHAFLERVTEITRTGYTCNMEYVAPTNRIVLEYQERALVLLNVRHNETGEYVPYSELFKDGALRSHLVKAYEFDLGEEGVIDAIRRQEGIEGFIVELPDGLKFKLKTEWYCALHHTKDSVNNNSALFEVVVKGGADDVKGMFEGDEWAKTKVEKFEKIHLDFLSESISSIEDVYKELAGKDRRTFATTAQVRFKTNPGLFGVLMQSFEKGIDYDTIVDQINKVFMKNHKGFIPEEYVAPRWVEE